MIAITYQQNSQLTFTSSNLTEEIVEQEANYVQSLKTQERRQLTVSSCQLTSF